MIDGDIEGVWGRYDTYIVTCVARFMRMFASGLICLGGPVLAEVALSVDSYKGYTYLCDIWDAIES